LIVLDPFHGIGRNKYATTVAIRTSVAVACGITLGTDGVARRLSQEVPPLTTVRNNGDWCGQQSENRKPCQKKSGKPGFHCNPALKLTIQPADKRTVLNNQETTPIMRLWDLACFSVAMFRLLISSDVLLTHIPDADG